MGINAITWGAGSVLGPVLGGLILAVASWRWIFLINLPIGIIGTLAAYLLLRRFGMQVTDPNEMITLYRGIPAENNRMTGYRGRSGIHELMIMNAEIANAALTFEARDSGANQMPSGIAAHTSVFVSFACWELEGRTPNS